MFERVFENLRTATETSLQMQQDLVKKWVSLWPGMAPAPKAGSDPIQSAQKKWMDFMTETVKRQRETMEAQFGAGLKNIEAAFSLAQAKDPEELRARTVELWQKSFDCLRKLYEAQVHDFQSAVAKLTEVVRQGKV
jgi:hypothetical protein